MNIQQAGQQLILLWWGVGGGVLARGSPRKPPPHYLSIWALSAPQPPGPTVASRPTSTSTLPLRLGPHPAMCRSISSRAHLCGVGSHRAAWQGLRVAAASPLLKQWEPTLIGKTQQDRVWLCSQEGQGKPSQRFSDWHIYLKNWSIIEK